MLRDDQDAFGHGMYDYYKGIPAYEVDERDDGFVAVAFGPPYYLAEYKDWPEHQKRAMKLVKGKTLDIGCGAGRNCLYLQKKGFNVTGIDYSPLAIKVCKLRGVKKAYVMTVSEVNKHLGVFDTVLMLGNNFGLFSNAKRAQCLLKRFHKMTTPDALILAESKDLYKTKDIVQLRYCERNKQRGRMPGQMRIRIRYKTYKTPWFDYLLVSRDEMKAILEGTGWRVREFLDSGMPVYLAVSEKE